MKFYSFNAFALSIACDFDFITRGNCHASRNISSMRGRKKVSNAAKSKRTVKFKALNKIAWDKNDNICLIHALWGMLTSSQRSLMTVRYVSPI
jgi:hypothetical protein